MSKYSVKKPFTVLVGVIIVIILGIVSLFKMQLDLLPEISLPYLLVITTYPGASAEKVEAEICMPMESAMGTINGVKNVYSVSSENYGMIELEFQDGTDLDSAMVKVSSAINTLESTLPEDAGTPSIMELSTDMMASIYLAVSYDGMSMEELSQFVSDEIVPVYERQDGVASVTSMGLIDKTIQIELNKNKVDILNDKILAKADRKFAEALEDLDDARQQLLDSQEDLDKNKSDLTKSQQDLNESREDLIDGIKDWWEGKQELEDSQKELDDSRNEVGSACSDLSTAQQKLDTAKNETYSKLGAASKAFDQLSSYQTQLTNQESDLASLKAMYNLNLNFINTQIDEKSGNDDNYVMTAEDVSGLSSEAQKAMGMAKVDASSFAGKTAVACKAIINGAQATIDALKPSYKAEMDALTIEIGVTKQIISGYEAQLKSSGMSYESLQTAEIEAAAKFGSADAQIVIGKSQLEASKKQLDSAQEQIDDAKEQLTDSWEQIEDGYEQLEDGQKTINESWDKIADGQEQINDGWDDYNDAVKSYEKQKIEALKKANADDLLNLNTLSQIIYAQNFSMPAGYVDDELDNSWLVKVGEHYDSIDELQNLVLTYIDDIGNITIDDVADITIIDNSGETYTKLNGDRAVILSIFKSSVAGTNDVSRNCTSATEKLSAQYPDMHIMTLVDQGDYITIIVKSVLQSMLIGALLAVIILAIFLKDARPTFVVAISIPLSVLGALVCMYFSDISLNMLSLSGIALGIGMLVDNSIVVIENIYRMRSLGVAAPRAAVYGTKQVAGAITSSTLTTACVFLPMIYTTGLVRDLMMPMCMAIIFCLGVSLFVALTVVPAAGSTVLKNTKEKAHPLFDRIMDVYDAVLRFCINIKIVPILVAIGLLALTIWQVIRMGVVIIPEMSTAEIEATLEIPETYDREQSYEIVDEVTNRILSVDGVGSVGVLAGDDTQFFISDLGGEQEFRLYQFMIGAENPDAGSDEVKKIKDDMNAAIEGIDCKFTVADAMSEMSSLTGSGLQVNIYGDDLNKLLDISHTVMDEVSKVDGYTDIKNGQEDASEVVHLAIDKNLAMSKGLSVAQIFQILNNELTLEKDAVTITVDDIDMKIVVRDEIDRLTYENLMDYGFTVEVVDEDDDTVTEDHPLSDFAERLIEEGTSTVNRKNQSRYISVTASVRDGYNTMLLTRELEPVINQIDLPSGYRIEIGGEYDSVVKMIKQMALVIALGLAMIYLVMVAQFQSLLSPFIVLFTVPLAFTGGLLSLWLTGENLSIISVMGFIVLMGTVVNNGIVFVDYTNQLRKKGIERHEALVMTGKTRMRPILMTALTTILAESNLIFGDDMGAQMGRGMALVIAGGLAYATLMTLFIIPVMYDILFKKQPLDVDTGSESLDDIPDETVLMHRVTRKRNEVPEGEAPEGEAPKDETPKDETPKDEIPKDQESAVEDDDEGDDEDADIEIIDVNDL